MMQENVILKVIGIGGTNEGKRERGNEKSGNNDIELNIPK